MSWIICGEDKQGNPFKFDSSAVKASCRVALEALLMADNKKDGMEILRSRATDARKPGLYKLLWDDGVTLSLAGFWIVFGHHYLEDGPFGPPDKTPPYAADILEALTEEVWWKNYMVYPKKDTQWSPTLILEWPNDLANRSQLRPPGLPLPDSEFAQEAEDDFGAEFWLERIEGTDSPSKKNKSTQQVIKASDWNHLPINRSLVMVIKGMMKYSRVRHQGVFMTVPVDAFGDPQERLIRPFPEWLDDIVETPDYDAPTQRDHFLGQPMGMPGGRVSFPISGWLTKNLEVWPMFPREIQQGDLAERDVGSKAIAQFKQAMSISLMVLTAIVGLSLVVKKATTPVLEDVAPPKVIMPQPALSLCSAEHEKFMEEFRCQIRMYASGMDTDKPFCKDEGSADHESIPLLQDFADLQPLYCGIRDRSLDSWAWAVNEEDWYNYGQLAAAKACFNVLGYPWQYRNKTSVMGQNGEKLSYPDPQAFFAGNLGINQLSSMIRELDAGCDKMRENLEKQLLGTMVSTFIGTDKVNSTNERKLEPSKLRDLVANNVEENIGGYGKICFRTGLEESPYQSQHFRDLCGGNPLHSIKSVAWNKLDRSTEAEKSLIPPEQQQKCDPIDSQLWPSRDLNSCSVLSRYERARFGKDAKEVKNTDKSQPDRFWQCHIDLSKKEAKSYSTEQILWDLDFPIPTQYSLSGAGVINQLKLDAGLQVLAAKGQGAQQLGGCWQELAEKMSKYKPVHPLLVQLEADSWPTEEQQLCGQVCAAHYRVQNMSPEIAKNWVTPTQDLDNCLYIGEPGSTAMSPRNRLDRLMIPWNYKRFGRESVWVTEDTEGWSVEQQEQRKKLVYDQVCAFNLVAQGYFKEGYLVGGIAPPVWAGSTSKTSGMAGDIEGPVSKAANNLFGKEGGVRSRATCSYVAAQCFASLMVGVMGDTATQPSEWSNLFTSKITETARTSTRELPSINPWCSLVHPYIGQEGFSVEGQLDFPCAKGVEEAQQSALNTLEKLIADVGGAQ